LTADEFFEDYYLKKPVIIAGMSVNNIRMWSKKKLTDDFGNRYLDVGTFLSLSRAGEKTATMTLASYVNYMFSSNSSLGETGLYVFDRRMFFDTAEELFVKYRRNHIFSDYPARQTFSIGISGMGIPFHFHLDAWLEVGDILKSTKMIYFSRSLLVVNTGLYMHQAWVTHMEATARHNLLFRGILRFILT
jgi:hypothetical protein